ncbi:MAG: DNA polymerase III subunit delta [Terriglobia bacterium]
MEVAAFLAQLRRKRFAPAYLLLGRDLYLRDLYRERVIKAAVPAEARSLAVARLSLKELTLAEVLRQAQTLPMLSPRQVLVLGDVERVGESDLEALENYFQDSNPATVLLFETEHLDRRTKLARLLLEKCELLAADSPKEEAEAQAAAQRFAQELGLQLEPAAAEELIFALGPDLSRLRQELKKLRAYVGAGGTARVADVAAVVVAARQFSVFDLVDLLAERRRVEALARVRRLLEAGENPIGIVGLLAWLYRQLLQAQAIPRGTPLWEAKRRLGAPHAPPGRVETLLHQARRLSPDELQQAFPLLLEADWSLKSSPPDATTILETLIVRLTTPRGQRVAVS